VHLFVRMYIYICEGESVVAVTLMPLIDLPRGGKKSLDHLSIECFTLKALLLLLFV
jgi:hypothetical protein